MASVEIDVKYVAHLARLALAPDEEKKLASQLGNVLGYIEKLKELDVTSVEPTAMRCRCQRDASRRNPARRSRTTTPAATRLPGPTAVYRAENRGMKTNIQHSTFNIESE